MSAVDFCDHTDSVNISWDQSRRIGDGPNDRLGGHSSCWPTPFGRGCVMGVDCRATSRLMSFAQAAWPRSGVPCGWSIAQAAVIRSPHLSFRRKGAAHAGWMGGLSLGFIGPPRTETILLRCFGASSIRDMRIWSCFWLGTWRRRSFSLSTTRTSMYWCRYRRAGNIACDEIFEVQGRGFIRRKGSPSYCRSTLRSLMHRSWIGIGAGRRRWGCRDRRGLKTCAASFNWRGGVGWPAVGYASSMIS